MCGIFGYVGNIKHDRGLTCLRTMTHRGPDGEGTFQSPDIFLGHRRLAILDLSDKGKQPMPYANDRYQITYNGEIYNFIEIRDELKKLGHTFRSESDTEVILASFVEWGETCVQKFNGMWAFAIWDTKSKELFLSRDRFGKKPLYYAWMGEDFVFASEMKAIAPLLPKIEPDLDIINDVSRIFYYESTERCLIKGINRYPAGHSGWVKNKKLSLTRYWHTLDNLIDVPETYEEQVELFRELFLDACKIRMRSDVPIGTALSGGLDSSAVFSTLSYLSKQNPNTRQSSDWQHAFAASFPGTPLDEIEWAERVAKHCRTNITPVVIDPTEHLDEFYTKVYEFEDLYITPHIPFVATYGAMRKAGVMVTLDGHGADELFGGYSFDYLHILHDEMFNLKNTKSVVDTYYDSQITDDTQFNTLPSKNLFILKQFIRNAGKKLLGYKNTHPDSSHPKWRELDYFTQKLYISFHQTVLPTLLRNYDRYSMMNGVEIRMPFMDHRLVSLAFSLTWQSKIRGGYTKAIIRDAVADLMPKEVAYRKTKIGFNAPMVNWFKGPMRTFFEEIMVNTDFKQSSIVDATETTQKIRNVIDNPKATFHEAEAAWIAITPYLWQQGFLKQIKKI